MNEYWTMTMDRSEDAVMKDWREDEAVLLSIVCTTYNHARYIEQALTGFLMQVTNFRFEIIVHDDASLDSTRDIVDAYAARFPNIIRTIYQTQNQYSKGRTSAIIAMNDCRGQYIAFCEGDDYWTDASKLQRQVDFLEGHEAFSLVFHNSRLQQEAKGDTRNELACQLTKGTFDLDDVILNNWFIPSQSMVFRRDALELPEWLHRVFGLDYAMHLILAKNGKVGYIDRVMGVYRVNQASISAGRPPGFFQVKLIQTLSFFDFYTDFRYAEKISQRLNREREMLYFYYLNGRPWFIRVTSLDYFTFKATNFFRRRRRHVRELTNSP